MEMMNFMPCSTVISSAATSGFGKDEEKAGGGVRRGGDEDRYELPRQSQPLARHFAGEKPDGIAAFAGVLDKRHAMKVLLQGKGLHDFFERRIDPAHKRHLLNQVVAVADEALADVIGGKHADQDNEDNERNDAQAGKRPAQELPRQIAQHAVDHAEHAPEHIIGGPYRDDHEQTGNEIFSEKP